MLLNKLFRFVITISANYNIDESHGLGHSMNVLHYSNCIYQKQLPIDPIIIQHKNIIQASAILHDMCDRKYINVDHGINMIREVLVNELEPHEINVACDIMTTMSYSKVKKFGFPDLGKYQTAYNIVREADLLSAYDFERSMIYHMKKNNNNLEEAYYDAKDVFEKRILKYNDDNLFFTEYGKLVSPILYIKALKKMDDWEHMVFNKKDPLEKFIL